jgi:hypothetical protein
MPSGNAQFYDYFDGGEASDGTPAKQTGSDSCRHRLQQSRHAHRARAVGKSGQSVVCTLTTLPLCVSISQR